MSPGAELLVEQPRDDKQQPQRKVNQDQRAKWGDENQIADFSGVFGVLQRQLPRQKRLIVPMQSMLNMRSLTTRRND
jgi:hypothetical protein